MENQQDKAIKPEQLTSDMDQPKDSESALDTKETPDGGRQAWLTTAGAAFTFFSALGFANSFGAFEQYYSSHQLKGQSADKIAWIGSISAFLQLAAGAIGGPLFDRYGAWVCIPSLDISRPKTYPLTLK